LNVINLKTHQLSENDCNESSAPRIQVAAICDLSKKIVTILIAGPLEAQVPPALGAGPQLPHKDASASDPVTVTA
jgi:hypothetical protein